MPVQQRAAMEGIPPGTEICDTIASRWASDLLTDRGDRHVLELYRIEYEARR